MGGSSTNVTVQGNLIANGNISTTNNISANLVTGTLTTAAQPNVTSVGTLTSLSVTGNVTSNNATVNTVTTNSIISKRGNIAVTTDTVIDSFPVSQYRSAKYVVRSSSDIGYESLEVLLIHDDINSYITVYAAINDGGGNTVSITTGVSSGNVELRATGLSTNTKINLIGTYVPD
jgi:gamma-glutamyltranspeptidase